MTSPATTPPREAHPALVELDDPRATDPHLTGGKASALARARAAGLPTLDGFVLTTAFTAGVDAGRDVLAAAPGLDAHWRRATDDGHRSLVVRSSSTVEDQTSESMAGQFTTVVDVKGWDAFLDAIDEVLASRAAAAARTPTISPDAPLAVLVQPYLHPAAGGVAFAADPVTGRADRLVVSAVRGDPDRLVSGEVRATEHVLDTAGTLVDRTDAPDGARLTRHQLRDVTKLVQRATALFGVPQDAEWAITDDDRLLLLQSRPLTTEVRGVPTGPVLGSGPVAETFPDPLRRLELDLFVPPLRDAVETALSLAGTASPRELTASPLVTDVEGVVVVDLELFGEAAPHRSLAGRVSARARRLRASWRVGRLRSALPALDRHLLRRMDGLLGAVPPLDELTSRQLLALLERGRHALRSLHGHEILTSLLVDPHAPRLTASSVALRTLTHARQAGASDDDILAEHPVVLSLAPPRIGRRPELPQCATPPDLPLEGDSSRASVLREALRLRVRWVQELVGRAAWELGRRLCDDGVLVDRDDVVHLRLRDLHVLGTGRAVATDVVHQIHTEAERVAQRTPIPDRFRLSDTGRPIAESSRSAGGGGIGAGGGVGEGPVTHDEHEPPEGAVLVVATLGPGLAAVLHRLAGLVCETGSVLAHTAILAREAGVPTVVGYRDARARLPEGQRVRVDGTSGLVDVTSDLEPVP